MSAIIPLRDMKGYEPEWYWFPRIPFGAITLVFGRAGIGKSTMVYDILARASIGERMPGSAERPLPPADVRNARSVIIGTEDAPERVAAVLDRAGADLDSIAVLDNEQLPNPKLSALHQVDWLAEQMLSYKAKVLYVDNVGEAMLDNTETNNEKSVRHALRPVDTMAKHLGIAVIMTTHPKKGIGNGPVTESITGSQAYTNLARSCIYVEKVPHSDQVGMAVAKSNYYPAARVNTLGFKTGSEVLGQRDGHDVLGIPWIDWTGILPYNAQQLADEVAKAENERRKEDGFKNGEER